jgi:hypothetical protein
MRVNDPAWQQEERPDWDDHLEGDYEDAQGGVWIDEPEPYGSPEPIAAGDGGFDTEEELMAWVLAHETDLEERRFALADQFGEEWRP